MNFSLLQWNENHNSKDHRFVGVMNLSLLLWNEFHKSNIYNITLGYIVTISSKKFTVVNYQ